MRRAKNDLQRDASHLPADVQDKITRLRRGECIFCDRTGFKNPVQHISLIHGTADLELRATLGVSQGFVLCPMELHESRTTQMVKLYQEGRLTLNGTARRGMRQTGVDRRRLTQADAIADHDGLDHPWDETLLFDLHNGVRTCLLCHIRARYTQGPTLRLVDEFVARVFR